MVLEGDENGKDLQKELSERRPRKGRQPEAIAMLLMWGNWALDWVMP